MISHETTLTTCSLLYYASGMSPTTKSQLNELLEAVRSDEIVGRGTSSAINREYSDAEIIGYLREQKITCPDQAVNEYRRVERNIRSIERNLRSRRPQR